MTADPLRIGILNLMHDKVDTQLRFTKVLSEGPYNVDVQYFYPQTHYTSCCAGCMVRTVRRLSPPVYLRSRRAYVAV